MNLGENMKRARVTAGITQSELADKLGVTQKNVSRWECGERTPSAITLAKICMALGASADDILELR